jgi:hypothetical protein
MGAMLRITLYSYPYFKRAKHYVFLIITYVFSSTQLEKGAEQLLPRSEGGWGEKEWAGGRQEK